MSQFKYSLTLCLSKIQQYHNTSCNATSYSNCVTDTEIVGNKCFTFCLTVRELSKLITSYFTDTKFNLLNVVNGSSDYRNNFINVIQVAVL
jgi:hypothetical protein